MPIKSGRCLTCRRIPSATFTKIGFSLTDLMISVCIIAIMTSFAIPTYSKYVRRSKTVEALEMLKNLHVGQAMFYHKLNEYILDNGEKKDCGSNPSFTVLAPFAVQSFAYFDTSSSRGKGKPPKGQKEKLWWENTAFDPCNSEQSPDEVGASTDSPTYFTFGSKRFTGKRPSYVRKDDIAKIYAKGDLDGDGVESEFVRIIYVDERDMHVYASSGIYESMPTE